MEERLAMGDCAIQIDPDEDALVETAVETAKTAAYFGIDPKVAMLSYSTKGSGKGDAVTKVANATAKIKAAHPELKVDGEMQFDAAVSPTVGQLKFPGSPVAGHANTFIFPEIQSGNIGYKIAQRLGGFAAYGPILQGLNAPHQRPVPWLRRRRGLQDGPDHRRPGLRPGPEIGRIHFFSDRPPRPAYPGPGRFSVRRGGRRLEKIYGYHGCEGLIDPDHV